MIIPCLICLNVVLPTDTFVLGFHFQLSWGLWQGYTPVRHRPVKNYTIEVAKMWPARKARAAGPPAADFKAQWIICIKQQSNRRDEQNFYQTP